MMNEKLHIPRKIKRILIPVFVILLGVFIPVGAWYAMTSIFARTAGLEIADPPLIYIKDEELTAIESFHMEDLVIGKDYHAVFGVAPGVQGTVEEFMLGVIYTKNIGMDINIYPVVAVAKEAPETGSYEEREIGSKPYYFIYKKSWESFKDVKEATTYGNWTNTEEPRNTAENYGIYKKYTGLEFGSSSTTSPDSPMIDRLNDTGGCRFFVLSITWPENFNPNQNVKETDIVYIVSKGTRSKSQSPSQSGSGSESE